MMGGFLRKKQKQQQGLIGCAHKALTAWCACVFTQVFSTRPCVLKHPLRIVQLVQIMLVEVWWREGTTTGNLARGRQATWV